MSTHTVDFFSYQESAEFIGQRVQTLRAWWSRERKGPPRIKVGRRVIYRRQAVVDWLVARETMPTE
jgi:hypothetical protein